MLSSKLGNSSELFLSSPEDFSIIKRNKNKNYLAKTSEMGKKKVAGKSFLRNT